MIDLCRSVDRLIVLNVVSSSPFSENVSLFVTEESPRERNGDRERERRSCARVWNDETVVVGRNSLLIIVLTVALYLYEMRINTNRDGNVTMTAGVAYRRRSVTERRNTTNVFYVCWDFFEFVARYIVGQTYCNHSDVLQFQKFRLGKTLPA